MGNIRLAKGITVAKSKKIRPTDAELEILRVLWHRGPSTVKDAHAVISQKKTLKLLQIMHEKGIVTRDRSQRPQLYQAAIPEDIMQERLVSDFLSRAFGGSTRKLMAALTARISDDELAEIKQLLDEQDKE